MQSYDLSNATFDELANNKFNTMAKAEQPDLTPSFRQEGDPHRLRALDN
jgi:hypothetical protein